MQNIIINRTKKLIKLLIENNIKNIEYMNSVNDEIFESDCLNWQGRYISISTQFKETVEQEIKLLGCKVIKERNDSLLIFLGVDYKAENLKLSTQELVEIFSSDEF